MKEQTQQQTQGGEAMKKTQAQQNQAQPNQTQIYFVTFPTKVDSETAKQVLTELRKRFPQTPIFVPKPPPGKRVVLNIAGSLVIVTFPYKKNPNPNTQQASQNTQGFSLKELIKKS